MQLLHKQYNNATVSHDVIFQAPSPSVFQTASEGGNGQSQCTVFLVASGGNWNSCVRNQHIIILYINKIWSNINFILLLQCLEDEKQVVFEVLVLEQLLVDRCAYA